MVLTCCVWWSQSNTDKPHCRSLLERWKHKQRKSKLWACLSLSQQQQNLEWQCWMLVNMLFRLDWSILLVIFGDTTMSGGLNLSFSKNKRCPKAAWLQMCYPFIIQFQLEKDGNNFISNQFGTSKLGIHRTSVKEPLHFFFFPVLKHYHIKTWQISTKLGWKV